jgi:hypothetical protein
MADDPMLSSFLFLINSVEKKNFRNIKDTIAILFILQCGFIFTEWRMILKLISTVEVFNHDIIYSYDISQIDILTTLQCGLVVNICYRSTEIEESIA